jgi:hypothetical protein
MVMLMFNSTFMCQHTFLMNPLSMVIQTHTKSNKSYPPMSSEINTKNITMNTFEEVPDDVRKAFEIHSKDIEECRKAGEPREL